MSWYKSRKKKIISAVELALSEGRVVHLREVQADYDGNDIFLYFFFNTIISSKEIEFTEKVVINIFRCFPKNFVKIGLYRADSPLEIPVKGKWSVFSNENFLKIGHDKLIFMQRYLVRWAGYRELVDFKERVGWYVHPGTGL